MIPPEFLVHRHIRGKRACWCCRTLQRGELRRQVGFVLGGSGLEHLALLGVQPFGVGAELLGREPCELERDLLELGILAAALLSGQVHRQDVSS